MGLRSVLSQRQGDREVVIAYASRVLSKAERNYDVTKRAVVFGLKTFKHYLLGRHFVVRTDHSALQWIRRTPEPMGQLARWLTLLEQLDFEIQFRSGAKYGNCDGLSRRLPSDEVDTDDETETKVREITQVQFSTQTSEKQGDGFASVGETDLADLQAKDPDFGAIVRLRLEQSEKPDLTSVISESPFAKRLLSEWPSLEVVDGVTTPSFLCTDVFNITTDVLQLLLPRVSKKDFLSKVHGDMSGVTWAYVARWIKFVHFGQVGVETLRFIASNVFAVTAIFVDSYLALHHSNHCLLERRLSGFTLI